jgi:hypothetical protein
LNFDGRKERILEWEKNFCSDEIGICTHFLPNKTNYKENGGIFEFYCGGMEKHGCVDESRIDVFQNLYSINFSHTILGRTVLFRLFLLSLNKQFS